ncbi:hypothetical protein DVK85_06620 [Flavobacterium arcticum]|uniref:Uncharacterized protein n=1 Tax=Flavobacterium arcticum TaxID=1784713 RepID=A0A345HBH3_9FLAO|nr:hypothetical protein [Flavobacterium arcticum]AXG73933.1 hypothetical protein DVK85_06620 [Flavobacterium arcticum]KAF2508909.1 hypothetical protein E0W72_10105 [Flavobacterium arcticum]
MIIINTVSDTRFSFNGIEYLKNYTSTVHNNSLSIFNCYERKDVLLEPTPYNQVTLDGQIYSSASGLHAALLSVIYTRSTLAGGTDYNQDNRGKKIYLGSITEEIYPLEVIDKINAITTTITATDSPVLFWGNRVVNGQAVEKLNYLWMGGKGVFGAGGQSVNLYDLYALPISNLSTEDILGLDDTVINPLGEIPDGDFLTVINQGYWELNLYNKTYFFSYTTDDVLYFVTFVGEPDIYEGNFTEDDFISTANSAQIPEPIIPTQQQVTAAGSDIYNLSHLFYMNNEAIKVSGIGLDYKRDTKQKDIRFEQPNNNDAEIVTYTIPAKADDDTFAMKSDSKKQELKIIDSFIIDGLYTIVNDDFGKTLVYNGAENINMLLSTNVSYETGYFLNFLQASTGNIELVTDGFVLHHAPDELPITYGFYSLAGVTILEEFSAMVFGKLKLAD